MSLSIKTDIRVRKLIRRGKPAEEWLEEMFSRGNWVVADIVTLRAIQLDAAQAGMRVASGILIGMATDRFKPQSLRDVEIAELIQHRANNLTIEEL